MNVLTPLQQFLTALEQSVAGQHFVKLLLGNYRGAEAGLQKINVRKIILKKGEMLSFTLHYKTRDIVKNYTLEQSLALIESWLADFHAAMLCTLKFDMQMTRGKSGAWALHKHRPSHTELLPGEHNRAKPRLIEAGADKQYLHALHITDANGAVLPTAQDKYRQINKYIEILSGLMKTLPADKLTNIVDMGSGKGYLTFALYDYLAHTLKREAKIIGVEARAELVTLCNDIAEQSGFSQLHFAQGTIAAYDSADINVLIALHACDTATDDAIAKGIHAGAQLIVVAPCCHKQIRREMETYKAHNDLGFLLRHGIFMERQAEMVTDGLRALILEYFGYSTKVFEFISDAHTPKNVMIVGTKNMGLPVKSEAALRRITEAKAYFGIGVHALEKCVGM